MAPQIPVVVLAGFLGSGKTTLLNHLLSRSGGTRIGAVVNDFGAIEIDAMLVAGQVDSMVSLGNGCLCCAVDTSELDEYLERLARPSSRIDVIVIEASGLAEPQELIRMILASESDRIVYGGLVEVVDGAEFENTRARHPELDRHLGIADLVVLNKADRIDDERRTELLGTLGELAPGTPVVPAAYGRVDPGLLFERRPREGVSEGQLSFEDLLREEVEYEECAAEEAAGTGDAAEARPGALGGAAATGHSSERCNEHEHEHEHEQDHRHQHRHHMHSAYETVEFTSAEPMHPRRLMEFLDARPAGLYRIKGFVHFGVAGSGQKFTVHAVGGFLRFYPGEWEPGEERLTQLVLIGSGIDAPALRKELDGCRDTTPEETDPHSMWGVLRYVPSTASNEEPEEIEEPEAAEEPEEPEEPDGTGV
ncbi:cobalamin biosynthesis protein CobW [Streptomyces sp. Ru73]|uniref:CobW family GTP-binding protein n=1 Tax=Streptomyces sp. Ru73 TaxID=2080748 RepID=UPI000CDD9590|nr:CobW family GTP-binding protein [Streptomyces sp. Ru73]POX41068.1 cobalamin biosynthesis protein CobW [Streptomyces sp. Ru73]